MSLWNRSALKKPTDAKDKKGEMPVEQEDEDEDEDEEDEEAEEEEEEEDSSFDGGNLTVREINIWLCFGYASLLGFEIPLRMPYLWEIDHMIRFFADA